MNNDTLYTAAVAFLKQLIAIPSFSKEEDKTASVIEQFFQSHGIPTQRFLNNVWAVNKYYDASKPGILLNSHHDTVKPNKGYTVDPFDPAEQDGKLFGLGSNDAGGCLVSLAAVFLHFYAQENLAYNIVFAASAEEEISGTNGIEALLPQLPPLEFGIVGEPTLLNMAVAERGLMVLDAETFGVAGHAARNEGENALYKAVKDIEWIQNHRFEKVSDLLGEVKMTVTSFQTDNKQHNVIPVHARYLIDVRVNELYSFDEVLDVLKQHVSATITPRSTRLRSTSIALDHPLIQAGIKLGRSYYGSPTTSDKALMHFPTLKMGPGDSARSHTANEFIYLDEIRQGIDMYIQLLKQVL
ncbi:MAG: M20 family metallo-hydrolase [Sphingobacteriia bacterium]|nr:M20 family metallo-hydrolase [Sphingobacteriia bacterium]